MSEERAMHCKHFKLYPGVTNRDTLLVPKCESPNVAVHDNVDNGGCNKQCVGFGATEDFTIQSLTTANAALTAQLVEAREALEGVCRDCVQPDPQGLCKACAVKQALSRTPDSALARYRALEKAEEVAKAVKLLFGHDITFAYADGWGHDAKIQVEKALREWEEASHA
jgi:hypothetical protein